MDRSLKSENSGFRGCEIKSEDKQEAEECANVNYNPCGETSSPDLESSENLLEDETDVHTIKQEDLSGQSDASLDDSSNESPNEEFDELLQQCYSKSGSATTAHKKRDEASKAVEGVASTSQSLETAAQNNIFCFLCKKVFSQYQYLKRHIRQNHLSEKKYHCTQCDKSYSVKSRLTEHVKHFHGDKKYNCEKCDYTSNYSHHLRQHISAVHLEEKPHKCPQCESCFSKKYHLIQHIKSVHNGEKPFECSYCFRKFSTRQHCDGHSRTVHCGEKTHSCAHCDYKCSSKSNLKRHQKTVHDAV